MSPHRDLDCEAGPNGTFGSGNGADPAYTTRSAAATQNGPPMHNGSDAMMSGTTRPKSPYLRRASPEEGFDLICVGFGPASLAVAVALHDNLSDPRNQPLLATGRPPRVLFLEKQPRFAWHAGMLLPGAKMQISFLKDLATLRDPRSEFTFLNYLSCQDRLVDFTNLGTFLPARVEYDDYLRWCAEAFEDVVAYNHHVEAVDPLVEPPSTTAATTTTAGGVGVFSVTCRDVQSGQVKRFRAKNVLLAVGGQPKLPRVLALDHGRVVHSSQYAHQVPRILPDRASPYRVAVVGAGQSAAEIFANIQSLYPNSRTSLVMRAEFLRPSDDSPFINAIFNPSYVDELHPKPRRYRQNLLADARATNYGVVRLELIEELYGLMYDQKRDLGPDETRWPHRILGGRAVSQLRPAGPEPEDGLVLSMAPVECCRAGLDGARSDDEPAAKDEENIEVDLVIAATGYQRNAHVDMLRGVSQLLPDAREADAAEQDGWQVQTDDGQKKCLEVGRDYRVRFEAGAVQEGSGVWLQGCCEGTHGISDTLLSVLATRSDEIVRSIFKPGRTYKNGASNESK